MSMCLCSLLLGLLIHLRSSFCKQVIYNVILIVIFFDFPSSLVISEIRKLNMISIFECYIVNSVHFSKKFTLYDADGRGVPITRFGWGKKKYLLFLYLWRNSSCLQRMLAKPGSKMLKEVRSPPLEKIFILVVLLAP